MIDLTYPEERDGSTFREERREKEDGDNEESDRAGKINDKSVMPEVHPKDIPFVSQKPERVMK